MPSTAKRWSAGLRGSRIALFSFMVPVLGLTLAEGANSALRLLYILLGFSLIIFLHELGHFVVARLCSVKCLAFSIGIGPRLCGWRKGGKLTFGNDPYDPENKAKASEGAATEHDLQTTTHTAAHSAALGDCDYRVSWLPLGGYVRMLGQDDMDPTKVSNDPHAFNQRPIWQRMCIVSAGVIMNLIFAAVTFSIIFHPAIGVEFPAAVVGAVYQNMPAAGQLHMGDEIVQINDKNPPGKLEFTDIMMESALSDGDRPIKLVIHPYGTPAGTLETKYVKTKASETTKLLAIGVESLPGTKIAGSGKDYVDPDAAAHPSPDGIYEKNIAELEKVRTGDKITEIDGQKVEGPHPYMQIYQHLQDQQGAPVVLTLENTKEKNAGAQTVTLYPRLEPMWGIQEYPKVFGIGPRTVIDEPAAKSPAAGKLKEGDRLVRVGAREYPGVEAVREIVSESKGEPIDIEVERGSAAAATTGPSTAAVTQTYTLQPKYTGGRWIIGVPLRQDIGDTAFIPPADPDSPLARLPRDARITAVDGVGVKNWMEIYRELRKKPADAAVPLTFATTDGTQTIAVKFGDDEAKTLASNLHYQLGLHLEFEMINQHGDNPGQAVMLGIDHTKKFIVQVYMTLAGLFRGTVSPSNLHGIVGITKVGYDVQERGPVWLWYVLAMVSVNLAVANFLPLPIVDGGLFLLLILEKIRGKPLSLKVQSAIQMVGVVLLIGLFLFVTYNDISLFHK